MSDRKFRRMLRTRVLQGIAVTIASGCWLTTSAIAQQVAPRDGGFTSSLGQPKDWKFSTGVGGGWVRGPDGAITTATAHFGMFHDLVNPVIGGVSINLEGYAGVRDAQSDGGVRARIASPALRVGVGADFNLRSRDTRFLVSLYSPIKRGGFFNNGTELRFDVLPWRSPAFSLSIEMPVMRRIPIGKTRPRRDHVRLSSSRGAPLPAPANVLQLREPLSRASTAASFIRRLNIPFLDETSSNRKRDERAVVARLQQLATAIPAEGDTVRAIELYVQRFHAEIEQTFAMALSNRVSDSSAISGVTSKAIAARARRILLDEVLFPYNRLIGQVKDDDTTEEFAKRARGAFARWLLTETKIPHESVEALAWVFSSVLGIVEENRAALRREWEDSRFVWLPLQYGLTEEQHDTQAELDSLIEDGVDVRFSDGNSMSYVINEQFQHQLSRTIHAARDYHVLWIHDFRGYDETGDPDQMSYLQVLHSYFAAITNRVREYDSTGVMPQYMILLDEWFYVINRGRLWMNLLEDPLRHDLQLPGKYDAWELAVRRAQDSLRQAIRDSKLLQAHRAQHGEEWLHNFIKVHVSITNASDPSYWSWRVAKGIPLFDNLMRDHRKLVFYDVTEDDPYRGEALFTGAGVGEHYANQAWEDRALLVQGPALLNLKTAARAALLQQGIPQHRIPVALQPKPLAADYDDRVRAVSERDGRSIRALTIMNQTGFGDKDINVAKGVLYTLMPAGSVIKIPDSLWNSAFWGSALVGCALRGVRVLVIGPVWDNAPARAFGSMIRSQELFWRLLTAARELGPQIERAGGLLKVGLFATELAPLDLPGKLRATGIAFEQHLWLQKLFGYPPSVYDGMDALAFELQSKSQPAPTRPEFESDNRAKLHLKSNFFASREGWRLMGHSEWDVMTREFSDQRLKQPPLPLDSMESFGKVVPALLDVGANTVNKWFDGLSPETRQGVIFFAVMGSQNQNARSMVQDGEDAIVVSSWPAIIPYLDLISLVGQSKWLEDPEHLAALFPPQSGLKHRLAHWFKLVF